MIYEVHARLLFTEEDEAKDFFHDCEIALTKTTSIHPGTTSFEASIVQLIDNRHDENPVSPCEVIKQISNPPSYSLRLR